MSDLQIGLAVIGAIVIAGVIAYNKWQEVRLARRAERDFGSRHQDVLVQPPGAGAPDADEHAMPPPPAAAPPLVQRGAVEHTLDDTVFDAGQGGSPSEAPPGFIDPDQLPLDPALDAIVRLDCPRPVSGADVLDKARALLDEGLVKPVRWEAYESVAGAWGPVHPDRQYDRVRAGLQLADRKGAANEEDLGAFLAGMQEVSLALAAEADYPDPDEMLARARALDGFAADVDVQIGVNIISTATQPFAGTKLRALAEANGLLLGPDGRFHRIDDRGDELFSLANSEPMPFHPETIRTLSTRSVTVLLDVPRAPGSASTFRLFLDFARQLEQSLGGMLVDDNKRPIGQAALDAIGRQLETLYGAMDTRGIPAGSPAARRLFS